MFKLFRQASEQTTSPKQSIYQPSPKYPKTNMTLEELMHAEAIAPWGDEREYIANAAIARAIEDGQVVTREYHEKKLGEVLSHAA